MLTTLTQSCTQCKCNVNVFFTGLGFSAVLFLCVSVCAASTARHLYLRGGVGVLSMTKIYGGRKRNGVCPSHFSRGSKNVARKVLQALESLKMVEKDPNG